MRPYLHCPHLGKAYFLFDTPKFIHSKNTYPTSENRHLPLIWATLIPKPLTELPCKGWPIGGEWSRCNLPRFNGGDLYYQPKQCTIKGKIPKNYHTFAAGVIPRRKIGPISTPKKHCHLHLSIFIALWCGGLQTGLSRFGLQKKSRCQRKRPAAARSWLRFDIFWSHAGGIFLATLW